MKCVRAWSGALAAVLLFGAGTAACEGPSERRVVVVGFRADPGLEVPGQVLVSDDGETFSLPEPMADGEWITEVTRAGERFLAVGLGGGLWESDFTGRRWEGRRLHDGWLDAVAAPRAAPGVIFAAGLGAFWRSDDGGATWVEHVPPGLYFEDFAFLDGAHGVGVEGTIVPASGAVWRTADGGASWEAVHAAEHAVRAVAVADHAAGELWAVGDAGIVLVSTDGGLAWRDLSGPTRVEPPSDLTDLDFAADGEGWMVGTRGAARVYRGRGLPADRRWTHGGAGDFVLQGVFAAGAGEAYACGYRTFTDRGVVLRTRDGGRHWRVLAETPGIFWYSIAGDP